MPLSEIQKIAKELKKGRTVPVTTAREILSYYDAQRRGPNIVKYIREEFKEAGVRTIPDFESSWMDSEIEFVLDNEEQADIPAQEDTNSKLNNESLISDGAVEKSISSWIGKDPTYRISKLKAANQIIIFVNPDSKIAEAITLLLEGGFSQLPVMSGEFTVKGIITWKSIGLSLGMGKEIKYAKDCMQIHHEIRSNLSIFDAIPLIVENQYVLVRNEYNKISGIITSSDLSLQFRMLTEPFLLLSEIENLIRNIIGDRFTSAEMETARDPGAIDRAINDVSDLSFGEYIRLIQNEDRWTKLLLRVDRKIFCEKLDKVRKIRNDVMHFDPDGITDDDLQSLRNFTGLLKQIEPYNS